LNDKDALNEGGFWGINASGKVFYIKDKNMDFYGYLEGQEDHEEKI